MQLFLKIVYYGEEHPLPSSPSPEGFTSSHAPDFIFFTPSPSPLLPREKGVTK
jgi:hypothetical protein